jgi:NAD(P)-dependent dehydrogenase (short-subunit alcohol dehydrogenase family)
MVVYCGQSYLTPYSASKGTLATLTNNVANPFAAKRIRCNGILTGGWIRPVMVRLSRNSMALVKTGWPKRGRAAQG